jgi:hypothetical protein
LRVEGRTPILAAMRRLVPLCSGWLALALGCATAAPKVVDGAEVPAEAAEAMDALGKRLMARLLEEMAKDGPAGAVKVCRDEAPAITAQVAKERGVALGRTSFKLRNAGNAPRPWAAALVAAAAGKKIGEARPVVVDLGDRLGVLRPIEATGPCLKCHGGPGVIAPEVKGTLASAYPDDQATGFDAGDLRGFFWAEVPKPR